jgi:hypothetical protein
VICPTGGVRHALVARWVLSRSDPAGADRGSSEPAPDQEPPAPNWKEEQGQNSRIPWFGLHEPFDRADGSEQADRAAGKAQEQDNEFCEFMI